MTDVETQVREMTLYEVVRRLRKRGLPVEGTPSVLRDRLVAYMRNGEPFGLDEGA